MTEDERLALIAKLETSIEETKLLTPEQALGILYRDGFVDIEGNLAPEYGGPPLSPEVFDALA